MKQFFLKWYSYNAWANRTIITCLERQSVNDEKILSILAHLVSANFIWLNRIKGLPKSEFKLWGNYSLSQLKQMVEDADAQWMDFINSTNDFNRLLKYHN